MKTKTWIWLVAGLLALCLGLSALLVLPWQGSACAQVWSRGKLMYTLDLRVDRVLTVTTELGTNVITVKGGKIAVTQADCPDGYCVKRGFCSSGLQIVCLPHELEIRFTGEQTADGMTA